MTTGHETEHTSFEAPDETRQFPRGRAVVIRRSLMALVVAAAVGAGPAQAATPGSFTGKVADDFILVGAHLGAQAADGSQSIRLYVCNSVPYTDRAA